MLENNAQLSVIYLLLLILYTPLTRTPLNQLLVLHLITCREWSAEAQDERDASMTPMIDVRSHLLTYIHTYIHTHVHTYIHTYISN